MDHVYSLGHKFCQNLTLVVYILDCTVLRLVQKFHDEILKFNRVLPIWNYDHFSEWSLIYCEYTYQGMCTVLSALASPLCFVINVSSVGSHECSQFVGAHEYLCISRQFWILGWDLDCLKDHVGLHFLTCRKCILSRWCQQEWCEQKTVLTARGLKWSEVNHKMVEYNFSINLQHVET